MEREKAGKIDFVSLNRQEYSFDNFQENAEMVLYCFIAFFIPFLLPQPQLVVGCVVNAMLVLAAMNLRGWKLLPVIMLPSLGALASGYILGASTQYLLYMVPFIWIGNAVLVFAVKEMQLARKMNRVLSLGMGAVVKSAILFCSAFALYSLGAVPALFLTSMGMFQLYTALIGGAGAFVAQDIKRRFVAS